MNTIVRGLFTSSVTVLKTCFDAWASNTVTKLLASNGNVLGTFAVGSFPNGVAVDGPNIWETNNGDATLTKLKASHGTVLGTFFVGTNPA